MPPRRRATYIAVAVAVVAVIGVVGFRARQEPTEVTEPSDARDAASTSAPPPRPGGVSEVRQARAPLPAGLTIRAMAFADVSTGYALYEGPTGSAIAVTFDGGFSWVTRTGPAVTNGKLTVTDADTLVISTDKDHYVSRDTGRTYTQASALPADLNPAALSQPATAPPVGPTGDVRRGADGRFWAVSTANGGVARTAVSDADGRTWTRLPDVAAPHPLLTFALSRNGGEVWLYGGFEGPEARAWHLAGGQWYEAGALRGLVDLTSAIVIDSGMLMIARAGAGPVALVGDGSRLIAPAGPDRVRRLALLPDGTVQGWGGSPSATYLGTFRGMSGAWVLVGLSAQS
jgi:hypothetical protein